MTRTSNLSVDDSNFLNNFSLNPETTKFVTYFYLYTRLIYRVYKKTEPIWNRSQRREAAQSIRFFINIDCLGTYDIE